LVITKNADKKIKICPILGCVLGDSVISERFSSIFKRKTVFFFCNSERILTVECFTANIKNRLIRQLYASDIIRLFRIFENFFFLISCQI
jgi:hypothetical protein